MTTSEIIKSLAEKFDKPQTETKKLLYSAIGVFREHLVNREKFTIPGFGTFDTAQRNERRAYNPHHKKMTLLPKKVVGVFRPSKKLKDQIK